MIPAARSVIAAAGLALALAVAQAQTPETQREEARRNAEAAANFARAFGPEGSEAYASAFRQALEIAYAFPLVPPGPGGRKELRSAGGLGGVDQDERYRKNLAAMLQDTSEKIWGGVRVRPGEYADAVAVQGNGGICTGTLIAPDAVITAAHCYCAGVTQRVVIGSSTTSGESVKVARSVSRLSCPVDLSTMPKGDLALLFLERKVSATPRRLARGEWINEAVSVRAVGFGRTEDPVDEPTGIKRQVDVPVASPHCNGHVNTGSGPIADASYYGCGAGVEIVAGMPLLDRDSCNGDSGGPVYIRRPDGREFLAGATSRAVVRAGLRPCGDGGIYARVDGPAVEWMRQQGVAVSIGDAASGAAGAGRASDQPSRPFRLARIAYVTATPFAAQPQAAAPPQRESTGVFRLRPDGTIVYRADNAPEAWRPVLNPDAVPQASLELPVRVTLRTEDDGVRVTTPPVLEAVASWRERRNRFSKLRFEALHVAFGALESRAEAMRRGTMSGEEELTVPLAQVEEEIVDAYGALGSTDDESRKVLVRQFLEVRRTQKARYDRNDQYPPAAYDRIYRNSRGAVALADRDENGSFCSGVLVSRDLVLTARHCFTRLLPEQRARVEARFNYERDLSGIPLKDDRYPFAGIVAEGQRVLDDGPRLDFALVRLGQNAAGRLPGDTHPPQCLSTRAVHRDDAVYVIGHPRGDSRVVHDNAFVYFPFQVNRFSFNRLQIIVDAELTNHPKRSAELERFRQSYRRRTLDSGDELFEHFSEKWGRQPTIGANSDTYHGNSGSPVYSRRFHHVVGIFTEGEPDVEAPFEPGWRRHEAAIPVTVIMQQLDRLIPAWRKEPGLCDSAS
ncbi:MAG: trypsin-like serine protease [Vicinamibacterales bacterium]